VIIGRNGEEYKVFDARNKPPLTGFKDLYKSSAERADPKSSHPGTRVVGASTRTVQADVFGTPPAVEVWMQEIEEAGFDAVLIGGRNQRAVTFGCVSVEDVEEVTGQYPSKVFALSPVNLDEDMDTVIRSLKRALDRGMSGAAVEPGYISAKPLFPNDPYLFPLYDFASEQDCVVQLQSGAFAGPRMNYCHPEMVDDVLSNFPRLKVVVGHGGYPYVNEIVGCAFKHRNLYICPDSCMFVPGGQMYAPNIPLLPDQFLFGTSHPISSMLETLQATLDLGFEKAVMENYLYNNTAQLLGALV